MAMNKKEQAAFDALSDDLRIARALRWSDYEMGRDIPAPSYGVTGGSRVFGWSINAYTLRAYPSWSERAIHGEGHKKERDKYESATQNGIAQYSTELRALGAMRRQVELDCAKKLESIDARIESATREAEKRAKEVVKDGE